MKFSLLSVLLTANSNNNWMWHLLPYLFVGFILICVCFFVYAYFWDKTREKLENEDEKEKYLLKRVSDNKQSILKKELKEGEYFVMFFVMPPYSSSKTPWKVKMVVKKASSGGFTPAGQMVESNRVVFSIYDSELSDLIENKKAP
jgi:predicted phosphohydrolase